MTSQPTCKITLLLALSFVAPVLSAGRSLAMSRIIIVPTARTIGAGRYEASLDSRFSLLAGSVRSLDMTAKVGIGERLQFDAKAPLDTDSGTDFLFFGKYTFAFTHEKQTAAAIGIENVGSDRTAVPFLALTHTFRPVDVTVGVDRSARSVVGYFTGFDYVIGEKLHILADYNTSNVNYASAGFEYWFARQWNVKTGVELPRRGGEQLLIRVAYVGEYE